MSISAPRRSIVQLAVGARWEMAPGLPVLAWSHSSSVDGNPMFRTDIVETYQRSPEKLSSFSEETYILLDKPSQKLVVHRDPLGAQPIYQRRDGDCVSFGFQISHLFSRTETPALDRLGLIQFATFQFCPAPWTIIEGVAKLSPGETRNISLLERSETKNFIEPAIEFNNHREQRDIVEVLEEIYSLLLVDAEQPIGSFTSGGIDSSTNALFLSERSDVRFLTAGFEDNRFDESSYAKELAAELGVDIHIVQSEQVPYDIIDRAIWSLAEPNCDRSIVPTAAVVSSMPSEIRSLVSGEGGDEFWGPPRRYKSPSRNTLPVDGFLIKYLEQISCTTLQERAMLFGSLSDAEHAMDCSQQALSKVVARSNAEDAFQGAKAIQAFGWLSENVLQKDQAVARMANKQVRFPLTATAAREYVGALGVDEHWALCKDKAALKSVLLGAGLEMVVNRAKHKFKTPTQVWHKDRCCDIILQGLQTGQSCLSNHICPERFSSISLEDGRLLFGLYVIERWFSNLCRQIANNVEQDSVC